MRLQINQRAAPGDVFMPYAFENMIGREIPFIVGEHRGRCTLVAAEVAEGGRSALLTFDTDDPALQAVTDPSLYRQLPGLSIGHEPIPAERSCHCLCGMHRDDGMFCLGADLIEVERVPLVGGLIEKDDGVPMCPPCAAWWRTQRPERIAGAQQ